ncbi:hypothetical protein J3L16_00765 [Alteromonas sp. 5E99-2]|uniref:hypothetical protein n=1 Tax=Alteromonas sp. 5E99-2 TaxID=2817683 RepID=UPI001A99BE16|nr:hypothetical protein [Alteromonas sp. 5E99-2]MBO1254209.1 hypothetical protein [Alteromonas sp. 5E99-2]
MKLIVILFFLVVLSGCELVSFVQKIEQESKSLETCERLNASDNSNQQKECDLGAWLDYWVSVSQLNWSVRKGMITELSKDRNKVKTLKIILLSNVNDTPYQTRLRAQSYGEQLLKSQDDIMVNFIRYLILAPAQRKLELESAIATLSRINTEHNKNIEIKQAKLDQQGERIQEQSRQIDKLLQLEKSIVNKPINEQP